MAILFFYLGLGTLLAFEEAGLFLLPGDISLVAAGLHDSGHPVELLFTWIAASAGMVVGASVLFHGVARARSLDRMLPRRARDLIQRHHIWGIAVARLVPGLRNATVFVAGSSGISYYQFLIGLVPAALVWSGALLLLGWFGGSAILAAFASFHHSHVLEIGSLCLLFVVIAFVAYRLLTRNHKPVSAGA